MHSRRFHCNEVVPHVDVSRKLLNHTTKAGLLQPASVGLADVFEKIEAVQDCLSFRLWSKLPSYAILGLIFAWPQTLRELHQLEKGMHVPGMLVISPQLIQ